MPLWWLASLIFHALLLGWLFFFSPVRVIDLTAKAASAPPKVSPARAAQVMEQVREQQAESLAGEVRALEQAQRELAALEAAKRDELRHSVTNSPAAIEKVATAQENAAKAQAAAEVALKQAGENLSAATNESPALTNLTSAARDAQTAAQQSQAEALEALALADPRFEPAYQAQAEANAAQSRAAQAQAEAEGQLTGAAAIRAKNAPKGDDLAEAKEMLRTAESQLAAALSNSVVISNSLPQIRVAAENAQAAYAAAQASGDKAKINSTKQPARDLQKALENAQKNLTRMASDIPKLQSRITEQTARVAKFSGKSGPPGMNPAAMQQSAADKLLEAQRLQAEAKTAQARAAKAFGDVRSGTASAAATAPKVGDDLASVYQAAVQTEAELAETYRRLRATDLAMQRQIPLARALELTDAARPARPELAGALRAGNADTAAQREAILQAREQLTAMRSLADSMLAQARGLGASAGQQQALEQLAAEDENQRAKDLTGAMRKGTGSGKGSTGSGTGRTGSGSGRTGSGGSSGGIGAGGSGSGVASGSAGSGSGTGLGGSGDGTSSGPPAVQKDLAAVPGRVIGAGAVPGRWMFVDSWYLLGPFDNAGRANLDKQFPPETVVDLNATYVGKRGRPVRWEFFQSPNPRIVPPFDEFNPLSSGATDGGDSFKARDLEYIIYYGFTELRATEECDVWIAVGSDDFSKLWIDDQLVWASGKQHKKWRVDEGFRKVHLKQGVNRVLFRVENGHAQTEFSLAVCAQ
ncbi:MAG: hypothetical protein RLY20_2726 [Verrucomicrobiota bacterium]